MAGGEVAATNKGLARRVGEGALIEGALEETPQSMQEQMMQNLALGKDPMEGVGTAAAAGLLSGGVMGGGMGALHKAVPAPIVEPPPVAEPDAPVTPVQPIAPEPATRRSLRYQAPPRPKPLACRSPRLKPRPPQPWQRPRHEESPGNRLPEAAALGQESFFVSSSISLLK